MGNVWFTGTGSDSLGKLKIPTLDFLLSWFWAASRRCMVETEESKQSIMELSSVEAKVFWPPPGRTPSWPKSQILTSSFIVLSPQSKHWREEKTVWLMDRYVIIDLWGDWLMENANTLVNQLKENLYHLQAQLTFPEPALSLCNSLPV